MNAEITFDKLKAQILANDEARKKVKELTAELDSCFKGKIKTPEDVYNVYALLQRYKDFTGTEYKITFEENTIV